MKIVTNPVDLLTQEFQVKVKVCIEDVQGCLKIKKTSQSITSYNCIEEII